MIKAVVAFVVIALIIYMLGRGAKPKAPRETDEERIRRIRAEYDAAEAKTQADHMSVWLPILESLPVVDSAFTAQLHSPIYDCVSDEFELPCGHSSFNGGYAQVHDGMTFGPVTKDEVRKTLTNFSSWPDSKVAFVGAGDCAYLLHTHTTTDSGSKIQRYVRTGPDAYQVYGWRSGMSPSAGKDDPTYFVRDIAAKPELWVRRMQALRERWPQNSNYAYAQRQCAHR